MNFIEKELNDRDPKKQEIKDRVIKGRRGIEYELKNKNRKDRKIALLPLDESIQLINKEVDNSLKVNFFYFF